MYRLCRMSTMSTCPAFSFPIESAVVAHCQLFFEAVVHSSLYNFGTPCTVLMQVQLLAPELQKPERGKPLPPDAYPRLNSSNNVEWLVHIAPGKSEELLLRYSVEFPSGSRIDGL